MTLTAKHNNKIYYSLEVKNNFAKKNKFKCICCDEDLIFHRDLHGFKIQHWNHKTNCIYETEPETQEHIQKKMWLYKNISNIYKKHKPDSIMTGDQKPDVLLELASQKIAIEIQCSPITYEKWFERTEKYSEKGIYVFWVFGSKWLKINSDNEKRVSVVEKKLHFLNYGKNYYLKDDGINPIHYQGIVRVTNPCDNCNSDFPCENCQYSDLRYSFPKTIKTPIFNPKIYKDDIKFDVFDNNGLKLAKLMEKRWWNKENDPSWQHFNQPFNQEYNNYKGENFG